MRAAASLGWLLALAASLGSLSLTMAVAPDAFVPTLKALKARVNEQIAPTATVVGRLSLDGGPVPHARIELHHGPKTHVTHTGPDGSFRLEGVPAGEFQVTIHPAEALPPEFTGLVESEGPVPFGGLDVPERYRSPATSGLRLHLPAGAQERRIELRR